MSHSIQPGLERKEWASNKKTFTSKYKEGKKEETFGAGSQIVTKYIKITDPVSRSIFTRTEVPNAKWFQSSGINLEQRVIFFAKEEENKKEAVIGRLHGSGRPEGVASFSQCSTWQKAMRNGSLGQSLVSLEDEAQKKKRKKAGFLSKHNNRNGKDTSRIVIRAIEAAQ
ncbi:hypothetical protein TNCV_790801 [Trichonephila clavipes]|nr:hypothetical protein TNCV_790801 [Trichonephila clavipes]